MKKRILTVLILALLGAAAVFASGCGKQTEEANQLVDEADAIVAAVQPKLTEVETLLDKAGKSAGSRTGGEASDLGQAQKLLDEIVPEIEDARGKIQEAASLNISETNKNYLEAKTRSMDVFLDLTKTMRELTAVLLADPTAQNPETLQKWSELSQTMADQAQMLQQAEDEATKILAEGSGQ